MALLNDTPRPVVTHSVEDATRRPVTCGNASEASPEPPEWALWTVIDAPRWHESGGVMSDDEPAPMTRDDVDALCLALPEVTNAQMGKSTIGATSTTAR